MTMHDRPVGREILCPACLYDLRGHRSLRCPECGRVVDWSQASASRIPWVYRAHRGFWRAYWQTVALVLRRPSQLAAEMSRRVSGRQARSFILTSWLLAVVVGSLLLFAAVLLSKGEWRKQVRWDSGPPMGMSFAGTSAPAEMGAWPINMLVEGPQVGLALPVWIGASLWLSMALLRGAFVVGRMPRSGRRRAWRLSAYVWAHAPIAALLLGAMAVALVLAEDCRWPMGEVATLPCLILAIVLGFAEALLLLLPTARLAYRTASGKWSARLRILLVVPFPWLVILIWMPLVWVSLWCVGFLVMVFWSMTH
jgi:hypothetical protein